ncbi:MAG TPA: hypothetical protein VEH31_14975, partial [Streptosporangiaceae bacterium]|nr:hypothetical protein [Streptosporangiaceae bacterium]
EIIELGSVPGWWCSICPACRYRPIYAAVRCMKLLHNVNARRSHGAAIATTAWTYQRLVGIMDIVGD